MRTTISLPDKLLKTAKQRARERDTTLSAVITEALVVALSRKEARSDQGNFTLITFRGDGPLPGVDLTRTSELYALDDVDLLRVSDSRHVTSRTSGRRGPASKARSRRK